MLTARTGSATVVLRAPWGSWLGLAGTLLALGTAGTLAFSDTDAIFAPVLGRETAPNCDGPSAAGIFCIASRDQLTLSRWLCVAALLVIASGWRPRLTAIPHWWIAFSVGNGISIPDGGDQVTQVLTLLLVPVLLGDRRRWHWQATPAPGSSPPIATAVSVVMLFAVRFQVSAVYFHASIAKLGQPEWVDGTAMYYWMNHPSFGSPAWLDPITDRVTGQQLTLALLSWLPLVIEFLLALSVLLSHRIRWVLLPFGIALHLGIGLVMGLWTFSLAMFAACILLLVPPGEELAATRAAIRRRMGRFTWRWRRTTGPVAAWSIVSDGGSASTAAPTRRDSPERARPPGRG